MIRSFVAGDESSERSVYVRAIGSREELQGNIACDCQRSHCRNKFSSLSQSGRLDFPAIHAEDELPNFKDGKVLSPVSR